MAVVLGRPWTGFRRISRLRGALGVNSNGVGIILRLPDQIEQLSRDLKWLRGNV